MRIKFLGTSSAVPTNDRGLSAILVKVGRDTILMDCGDGTQRQMIKSKESPVRIDRIFITHLHGDHFFGLFPLLQSLNILKKRDSLEIYAPADLEDLIQKINETTKAKESSFDIHFYPIKPDKEYEFSGYKVKFFNVDHAGFETYGVKIEESYKPGRFDPNKADELGVPVIMRGLLQKGFSIKLPDGRIVRPEDVMGPPRRGAIVVYSSDTRPTDSVVRESKGADLLIHEATYLDDLKDRAIATGHSTALEAGRVAREAGVKKLILTHFSARYRKDDMHRFLEEAFQEFKGEVKTAEDFMSLEV